MPFYPPNNPENQTFEKMKKTPGGIMILNVSIINENHIWCMIPEIWSAPDIFLSSWAIFCPFTPITARKMKISQKMKKPGDVIILYKCSTNVAQIMMIGYTVPEIWRVTDVIVFFDFGLFFCHFTPITAQKMKISKKWKRRLEISFYTSVPQIMIISYTVPEM